MFKSICQALDTQLSVAALPLPDSAFIMWYWTHQAKLKLVSANSRVTGCSSSSYTAVRSSSSASVISLLTELASADVNCFEAASWMSTDMISSRSSCLPCRCQGSLSASQALETLDRSWKKMLL